MKWTEIWTADKDGIIWRVSQWRCFNLSSWKEETWKNSGLNGNRTHDLCDTGAVQVESERYWTAGVEWNVPFVGGLIKKNKPQTNYRTIYLVNQSAWWPAARSHTAIASNSVHHPCSSWCTYSNLETDSRWFLSYAWEDPHRFQTRSRIGRGEQ